MYNLTTKINANLLPDITSFTNLFSDDIHLTNKGNYFIACVMYATLFKESPVGLSANLNNKYGIAFTDMPTAQQALVMQKTAWETVTSLSSWTGVVALNNKEFKSNILKTYPNPVLNELIIDNFEANGTSNYEIYNNLGKVVTFGKLENAIINTINLSNEFYFLRIFHNDQFKTVKFIKN